MCNAIVLQKWIINYEKFQELVSDAYQLQEFALHFYLFSCHRVKKNKTEKKISQNHKTKKVHIRKTSRLAANPCRNFAWNFSTITEDRRRKKREIAGISYKKTAVTGVFWKFSSNYRRFLE